MKIKSTICHIKKVDSKKKSKLLINKKIKRVTP